jgi:hypothetical protein
MHSIANLTVVILSGLTFFTGCSRTHQARGVVPSGFLGDYSVLRPGQAGEAYLLYINPKADFRAYDKVLLDPVVLWAPSQSRLARLSPEETEKLKSHLQTYLRTQLSQSFTIVEQPGPGVMRIRTAITEAHPSHPVMDMVTNVLPIGWVMTGAQRLLLGTHAFVGKASLEAEAVDAVTGERLLAAVDRRAGRKILGGKFSSWDDVLSAQETWAERIKTRLADLCQGREGGSR